MTQKHYETCRGCEHKARKGMVALVAIEHTSTSFIDRQKWRTFHIGLVHSAYRCGHVKEFKGLTTWSLDWARIIVDTNRAFDSGRIMAALADRESDEFETWDAALDWINEVRGSTGPVRIGSAS